MSTKPDFRNETLGQGLLRTLKWIGKAAAWVGGLTLAASIATVGYEQLDFNGYIYHHRTLDVYMSNNWLVGENRVCSLTEYPDANGKPTGKVLGLMCPVEDEKLQPHNLSVTFEGILDPQDMNGKDRPLPDEWKCTRGSDSFTCEAMAARRP
jgi:hypothetical protein